MISFGRLNIAFLPRKKITLEMVSDRHMIVWIRCVFISIVKIILSGVVNKHMKIEQQNCPKWICILVLYFFRQMQFWLFRHNDQLQIMSN